MREPFATLLRTTRALPKPCVEWAERVADLCADVSDEDAREALAWNAGEVRIAVARFGETTEDAAAQIAFFRESGVSQDDLHTLARAFDAAAKEPA